MKKLFLNFIKDLNPLKDIFKNKIFKTFILFTLGLGAFSAFSQSEDGDFFDFEEEVTCESLEEDYKQYTDIIKVYQIAVSQSLNKMSALLKKVQNQKINEEEIADVNQKLSLAKSTILENEFALSEKEWRIADAISRCIK